MKRNLLLLYILVITGNVLGQSGVIKGFVYDKKTGEPVPFSNVYIKELETGAVTDIDGFYQIPKLKEGTYTFKITNVQYDSLMATVKLGKDQILTKNFEIEEGSILDIVEVNSQKTENLTDTKVSVIKLDKKDIYRVPNIGGEADIISALTITPGVVSSGDQGGQIYVRGGTPIQNKILLDGMTIYNPFHSIGFFSVFETELIKSAEVYTGGFGAKYGGRISSIMDITYKDGNTKKVSGLISASPFMARAVLEVPLIKQKEDKPKGMTGSFIFSAKQSLIEWTSKGLYPYVNEEAADQGLPFRFTDLYGKFSFKTPSGSKFSIFGFYFGDRVNYQAIENLNWQSFGGGLNFILTPPKSKQLIKGHINFSNYATTMKENLSLPDSSRIFGFDAGFDFIYYMAGSSQLDYGIVISGFQTDFKTYNQLGYAIEQNNFSMEIAGYATYKLVKSIVVFEPGFRFQYYASYNKFFAEPRLSMKINAHENFRIKMAGGLYSQNFTSAVSDRNVTQLFYGFLSAPTNVQDDFTKPNGDNREISNGLQSAWHAIGGFEADIVKGLSINLEGYYKWFNQLTNLNTNKIYPDDNTTPDIPDLLKKDFIIESGEAWGVDFLLKYATKRINVWAAYSLAKVTRWDGFKEYSTIYDRRHNVNLMFTYVAGKKLDWEFTIRWNFGSGMPFTQTAGVFQGVDFTQGGVDTDVITNNPSYQNFLYGEINEGRLPDYHRMDISAKKIFRFKNDLQLDLQVSVTNVYNRKNIFYINRLTGEAVYQLPVLPSLGVAFKF